MAQTEKPTARIVDALEQLERERDGAPHTIPFSGHASSAGGRSKAAPSHAAAETPGETIRVWRRDEAHVRGSAESAPRQAGMKTAQSDTRREEQSLRELRVFRQQYGHHLQDVVDVLILALGWKAQKTGWVSVHLMDESLDPGVILGLAAEVAEKSDESVLVIDADILNGTLTRRVTVNASTGLGSLLARGTLPDEALLKDRRVSFLPAGTVPASLPAWLECRRLFDGCRQRYGLTLVYSPLGNENFLSKLLRASDEAWLWCVKDRTPKHTVRQITEIIRRASCPLSASVLVEPLRKPPR
ncbi:MAG: hypothetical protein KatS3mg112_1182 [Thermogutta sp.]|nr:MAG: hypothetical protein KatS3mg112_1182 [Thermogutta sp.]